MPQANPSTQISYKNLFESFKNSLVALDPVLFAEKYLTLEGKDFKLHNNGYKPFVEIYRYIGIKSLEAGSKPCILVKGRQVGATTMCAVLTLYFMCCGLFGANGRPPMRVMHCFPTLIHTAAYAKTKLNTMIASAKITEDAPSRGSRKLNAVQACLDKDQAANDSLSFKQFQNSNHCWVESTGIDGDRLRNRTVDCLFFDEVQDTNKTAIANAEKLLTKAQYGGSSNGVRVYLGTPKMKGSNYWKIWQDSTQQYYFLGCEKCNELFSLYTYGSDDWEKIWLYGKIVKCTKCGHEQDKIQAAERGKWIPTAGCENNKFEGFHINQLYNPEITKEQVIAEKPENHATNTERLYRNEILGEFFAGDAAPLTIDDINQYAADVGRKMSAGISISDNRKVYLGADWGKKNDEEQNSEDENGANNGGKSYSCNVLLVPEGNHLLIEFATRLKRNDFQSKLDIIEEIFRKYSVTLGVGDIGYAHDLTENLQRSYGDRFLGSDAKAQINGHIKYNKDMFPHTILFEKDYYYTEVMELIKKGIIRFPYGNYDRISWLVSHCASMEVKTTKGRSGEPIRRLVKGSGPSDGLAALVNAYIAYKFDTTGAFSSDPNKSTVGNSANSKKVPDVFLLHAPGLRPFGG